MLRLDPPFEYMGYLAFSATGCPSGLKEDIEVIVTCLVWHAHDHNREDLYRRSNVTRPEGQGLSIGLVRRARTEMVELMVEWLEESEYGILK